jgi:restriction endonuclease S subunit
MEIRRLRDLALITAGGTPKQPTGATEFLLLALKDVNQQLAPVQTLSRVTATIDSALRFQVREGDVVVTTRGTVFRAAVVGPAHVGAIAGSNLAIVRLNGSIAPSLLAAFLREPGVQAALLGVTAGAVTPGFTIKALGELQIRVPGLERQRQLVEFLAASASYREQMQRALELRQQACDAVISRELSPQDAS